MLIPLRRHKALALVLLAVSASLGLLVLGVGAAARGSGSSRRGQETQHVSVDRVYGVMPGYQGLTQDQKLDRSLSIPGVRGVLLGRTGTPAVRSLASSTAVPGGAIVTDFPFTVQAFLGPPPSPYPVGRTITLRIPGGTLNGTTYSLEGAPSASPGDELFVFVRDQGAYAGGNTTTVLVASSVHDVYEVRNGVVHGQGDLAQFAESEAAFLRHFAR